TAFFPNIQKIADYIITKPISSMNHGLKNSFIFFIFALIALLMFLLRRNMRRNRENGDNRP
ncbi:MAG: hypothetical protein ACP5D1_07615, partial [Bacteroidales bacterium]